MNASRRNPSPPRPPQGQSPIAWIVLGALAIVALGLVLLALSGGHISLGGPGPTARP